MPKRMGTKAAPKREQKIVVETVVRLVHETAPSVKAVAPKFSIEPICRCGDGPTPGNFTCPNCIMLDRKDAEREAYVQALADVERALAPSTFFVGDLTGNDDKTDHLYRRIRATLKEVAEAHLRPTKPEADR